MHFVRSERIVYVYFVGNDFDFIQLSYTSY